jgi:hypothetical protein
VNSPRAKDVETAGRYDEPALPGVYPYVLELFQRSARAAPQPRLLHGSSPHHLRSGTSSLSPAGSAAQSFKLSERFYDIT